MQPAKTQQLAAIVDQELADRISDLARANERSVAAEIRLALRAWAGYKEDKRAA